MDLNNVFFDSLRISNAGEYADSFLLLWTFDYIMTDRQTT